MCAVAYLSLYPWRFASYPRPSLIWEPIEGRRAVLDAVLNVFFYVPLGAAGVLAIRRRSLGWILTVLASCGLSFLIEWLQLWSPLRYGTWDDFATNSLGTIIGATAAYCGLRAWEGSPGFPKTDALQALSRWTLQPLQALFLACWILWQAFPFMPAIMLARLTRLNEFTTWSWLTGVEAFLGFAALRAVLGNSPWLLAAYAILPMQTFLMNRALSATALIGGAAGYFAAQRVGARWLVTLKFALPAFLLYEELRPFRFVRERQGFAWAPFDSWFAVGDSGYYPVLFGKLYLYTATVWSLRASGSRWRFAVGLPAAILAGGELLQQYIPGRTPETTDVVLVIIGAVLLAIFAGEVPNTAGPSCDK
jgi:VanZ family protein